MRIPIVNEDVAATFARFAIKEIEKYDSLEKFKPFLVLRINNKKNTDNVYQLKDTKSDHSLNSVFYIDPNGNPPKNEDGWRNQVFFCKTKSRLTSQNWYNPQTKPDAKSPKHNILELIYFINIAYKDVFHSEYNNGRYFLYKLNNNNSDATKTINTMMVPQRIKEIKTLLDNSGQVILQGAPGCGKTYITTQLAVYLCDGVIPEGTAAQKKRYKELQAEGRIGFTTFHQSLDYEEFVEGLKPETDDNTGEMCFEVKPGIFRRMCSNALAKNESNFEEAYSMFLNDISENGTITELKTISGNIFGVTANSNGNLSLYTSSELNKNGALTKEKLKMTAEGLHSRYWSSYYRGVLNHLAQNYGYKEEAKTEKKNYVLIIDEINRANISKVLGELITLLEKSKRLGNDDEFTVTLPYSGDVFGVPDNLYIIGTMNTADRSLGYIDYAIRRRFAFITLEADPYVVKEYYHFKGDLMDKEIKLFNDVRTLIKNHISEDFELKDIMVGHSYFMAKDDNDFRINLDYKIRPLLEEYLRDGILVENGTVKDAIQKLGKDNAQ